MSGPLHTSFWCKCFKGFHGSRCMHGPLCTDGSDLCRNGATCRHVGTSVVCKCPPLYTGPHCEVPLIIAGCDPGKSPEECSTQCRYDRRIENACNCETNGIPVSPDRWRYELVLRIANVSSLSIQHPGHTLFNFLEKQISRYFRSISLSRLEDFKILSINERGDMVLHFFGSGHDKKRVRDAADDLVLRDHLGDIALLPSSPRFRLEPPLHLNSIQITKKDRRESDVRIGDHVILICVAQGTKSIEFNWFKDGSLINVSKSNGELWTETRPNDGKDEYSSYLGIESVTSWEEGRYTCQVSDWGVQECKSVYLSVVQAPAVRILPMSASLQKGENINLKCVTVDELIQPANKQIGFSWAKDRELFPLNPGQEVWEDLKPSGSILRVKNIQKSTTYTCMAHTSASTQAKQSVRIEVVNLTAMAVCESHHYMGIRWGLTAPGSTALSECPIGYNGVAKRQCLLSEPGFAYWQRPDFSRCISNELDMILSNFRILARGYIKSSVEDCLAQLLSWLSSRSAVEMLPGAGEPVVELMKDMLNYLNRTESWDELASSSMNFYQSVDLLLDLPNSIINELRVRDLQVLLNRWSVLLGHLSNSSSAHFVFSTYVADIFTVYDGSHFSYYIPNQFNDYPQWYRAKVIVHIVPTVAGTRNTSCIVVVNFQNISNFLPRRSTQKTIDGGEVIYEIQSNVISIAVSSQLKVLVDLEVPLYATREGWNVTCGVAPSLEATWDFSACHYGTKQANWTKCVCQWPGVYSALLTKHSKMGANGSSRNPRPSSVVLIGCTCCLVQSLLAFVLLLLRWFHRKTCLLFLKLQCCASAAAAMCLFIYCARFPPSTFAFPSLNFLMETLMLLGLTSHLCKLLVVYTEVVRLPNVHNIKKTVFGITTGVTTLGVLSSILAHKLIGGELKTWWLPLDSAIFFIFVPCGVLVVVLFIFLFGTLLHQLQYLLRIQDEKTTITLNRRIGLLKRTGFLFASMISMSTSSIAYVNIPSRTNHYAFSVICGVFGFTIFFCYIIHSESSLNMKLLKQFKIYSSKDLDYSSESENNLFNFFTKQEAEVESECAPPCLKQPQGISMLELPSVVDDQFVKPKMVTFDEEPHFGDKKVEANEVNLEVYPNSPRKFSDVVDFLVANDDASRNSPCSQIFNDEPDTNPIPDVTSRSFPETEGLVDAPELNNKLSSNGQRQSEDGNVNCDFGVGSLVKSELANNAGLQSSAPPQERVPYSRGEILPTIVEDEDAEEKDVFDRISHDLDYLLNRRPSGGMENPSQRVKKLMTLPECKSGPNPSHTESVL
ncbi:Hypothetical protein NTJ_08396 [Nesidiocoris tenuis]|uniref:Ig-like domain-containing protein n=1 Tax=Nesidiocoris tenuis TaxID=355587 RepID=A0ABN7ATQ7_9HEMI|nr:Hypothetical protein NTJ_08396 [Nesidiocoris tenuis]